MGRGKKFFFPLYTCQEILRGWSPPWSRNSERRTTLTRDLTKRNLNIRKDGLRILGGGVLQKTAGSEPAETCSELGWWSLQSKPWGPWTWGPHVSKRDSIKAIPQSRATLFGHFSQRSDTLLCTYQAQFSLEWPPNIFNFQNYKKLF